MKIIKIVIRVYLFFTVFIYNALSAQRKDCPMEMGMNLYFNTYWSREIPFANLMMQSNGWFTTNSEWVPNGKNEFNTNVIDQISKDENGYPYELPIEIVGQEAAQVVQTILAIENGGIHPAGQYVILYEGNGEVELVGTDVISLVSSSIGRAVYEVKPLGNGDLIVRIKKSTKGHRIRNVKVLLPDTEKDLAISKFNPAFIEKVKPFNTIRFLNWSQTNNSQLVQWQDRPSANYHTQATGKGVAYEYMIDLCNEVDANIWINIPHAATNDYIIKLAQLLKSRLKPDLKIYVEYSNEVWNTLFDQYHWVEKNARPDLVQHQYKYSQFATNCFKLFSKEYETTSDRIIRVVSGQQEQPSILGQTIAGMSFFGANNDYDAISCTGSLALSPESYNELAILGNSANKYDVARLLDKNMNELVIPLMNQTKTLAKDANKLLVGYESVGFVGVHYPQGTMPPSYSNAVYEFQKDSLMYNLYNQWLDYLRDEAKVSLNCSFVLADENTTAFGSYGHLENIFLFKPYPLTYQVLLDNICDITSNSENHIELKQIKLFPTLVHSNLNIIDEGQQLTSFQIIDGYGHVVSCLSKLINLQEIDVEHLMPGIYFFHGFTKNGVQKMAKFVKI